MVKNFGKGKQVTQDVGQKDILPLRAKDCAPKWIWTHGPQGWFYSREDKAWLPRLGQINIVRGANGVDTHGKAAGAIGGAVDKGFTIIKPDDVRLGQYSNYLYEYDAIGGKHYATCWDNYTVMGKQVEKEFDKKGFHEFLKFLIDEEVIEPMSKFILRKKIKIVQNSVNRLQSMAIGNPHVMGKMADLQAQIVEMESSYHEQFGS